MKDIITQSEIAAFNDCRTYHKFAYDDLLKLRNEPVHFHIGTVMHLWLEQYYRKSDGDQWTISGLSKDILKVSKLPEHQLEELGMSLSNLTALSKVFPDKDPVVKYKLRVLDVERVFEIPDPQNNNRIISGRIDVVALDEKERLWVIDHKLMSKIDRNLIDSFALNQQVQTYLLALRADHNLRCMGRRIGGFIPNLIRKPALKQKDTEGDDNFAKRVQVAIYDDPDSYFYSEQLFYEESPNRKFEERNWKTAEEMRNPQRFINQNFGQCVTIYGRCPFFPICADQPGYESFYTKKTTRHEELARTDHVLMSGKGEGASVGVPIHKEVSTVETKTQQTEQKPKSKKLRPLTF